MRIVDWFKEYWIFIVISTIIFLLILFVTGTYDCWVYGDCPPVSNVTG